MTQYKDSTTHNRGSSPVSTEVNNEDFQRIIDLLRDHGGTDFSQYKPATLYRRVLSRSQMVGCPTLDAYMEKLETDEDEISQLRDNLLINVTAFFRNPDQWQALYEGPLSEVLSRPNPTRPIRAWVAGCSTGQEAYTVGILLDRLLIEHQSNHDYEVFATDIDQQALQVARRGIYNKEQTLEEVEPIDYAKYFEEVGSSVRVVDSLKSHVIISDHHLNTSPGLADFDLVFCRNVLIFMNHELQQRVLDSLTRSLRDGGLLMLGSAEAGAMRRTDLTTLPMVQHLYRRTIDGLDTIEPTHSQDSETLWVLNALSEESRLRSVDRGHRKQTRTAELQRYRSLINSQSWSAITIDNHGQVIDGDREALDWLLLEPNDSSTRPINHTWLSPSLTLGDLIESARHAADGRSPSHLIETQQGPLKIQLHAGPSDSPYLTLMVREAQSQLDRESLLCDLEIQRDEALAEAKRLEQRIDTMLDLVNSAPELVIELDDQGRVLSMPDLSNSLLDSLAGHSSDSHWLGWVHPKDQDKAKAWFTQSSTNNPPEPITFRSVLSSDNAPLITASLLPAGNKQDGDTRLWMTMRLTDYTDRIGRSLRQSPPFLDAALDAIDAHIAILDQDGKIVSVNEAWRRFGRENGLSDSNHSVGRYYLQTCDMQSADKQHISAVSAGLTDVLTGRRVQFEHEYPCHSPTQQRWFLLTARGFMYHDRRWVVLAHLNITQRRLLEIQIQEQAGSASANLSRIRQVIENLPWPLAVIDDEDRVTHASQELRKFLGITPDTMLPKPITEVMPSLAEVLSHAKRPAAPSDITAAFADVLAPQYEAKLMRLPEAASARLLSIIPSLKAKPQASEHVSLPAQSTIGSLTTLLHTNATSRLRGPLLSISSLLAHDFSSDEEPVVPVQEPIDKLQHIAQALTRWNAVTESTLNIEPLDLPVLTRQAQANLGSSPALSINETTPSDATPLEGDAMLIRLGLEELGRFFSESQQPIVVANQSDDTWNCLSVTGYIDKLSMIDAIDSPLPGHPKLGLGPSLAKLIAIRLQGTCAVDLQNSQLVVWLRWPKRDTVEEN